MGTARPRPHNLDGARPDQSSGMHSELNRDETRPRPFVRDILMDDGGLMESGESRRSIGWRLESAVGRISSSACAVGPPMESARLSLPSRRTIGVRRRPRGESAQLSTQLGRGDARLIGSRCRKLWTANH